MNASAIQKYLQGSSMKQLSIDYNTSIREVRNFLNQNNIHIRNRSEQNVFSNQQRSLYVNNSFFEVLNPIVVYYLGFLAADGTVSGSRNSVKVGLANVDRDWLIQMKEDLEIERPIRDYQTTKGYFVSEITFSSAIIKNTLARYSIVPRKTYVGVSMENIPNELKIHYIRGYFDGDGSYSSGKVKITSKTKGILSEIEKYMGLNSYLYYFEKREVYSLEYSTIPSLNFLEKIYADPSRKLDRKWKKYQEELIRREQ